MWTTTDLALLGGADDGNRTRILSLGTRLVVVAGGLRRGTSRCQGDHC